MITQDLAITESLYLNAPVSKVWDMVATPTGLKTWLCSQGVEGEMSPGQDVMLNFNEGSSCIHIEQIQPQSSLSFRWVPGEFAATWRLDDSVLCTITLEPSGQGTLLHLTETGFENLSPEARAKGFGLNSEGWHMCMEDLQKALTEEGEIPDAIYCRLKIEAPVERVFECLTNPSIIGEATGMDRYDGKVAPGEEGFWVFGEDMRTRIKWLSITPPTRFSYTWYPGDLHEGPLTEELTVVEYRLVDQDGSTMLLLTESGFSKLKKNDPAKRMSNNTIGWTQEVLPKYKEFLEGANGRP